MKVGFLLPAVFAVGGNHFNGVREQALMQAEALTDLGIHVTLMSPWEKYAFEEYDVVQFFGGGPAFDSIENHSPRPVKNLVLATIIDSQQPNWAYRTMRYLGMMPKLKTIQSHYYFQSKASRLVIARSTHEREKLVSGLGIPSDRVEIVLNGCPLPRAIDLNVLERFGLPNEFALHVSCMTNPVKNVINMMDAIGPTKIPLVLAGSMNEGDIKEKIKGRLERYSNIRYIGKLTNDERDALYSSCKLFCLPSLCEGTGLVAVEAASYGAAVLITSKGGPPDYFGDRAYYTTQGTVSEIQNVFLTAWNSSATDELKTHVTSALTWERSAERLASLYQRIIDSNP